MANLIEAKYCYMNNHFRNLLILVVGSFAVFYGISAAFFGQGVESQSANLNSGSIKFEAVNPEMKPGTNNSIAIKSNIGTLKVDGFQVVANITGTIPSNVTLVDSDLTSKGLRMVVSTLIKNNANSAKMILLFITTNPESPAQIIGDVELGRLNFTVPSSGEMTITIEASTTKIVENKTEANIVILPGPSTYNFLNTAATIASFAYGNPQYKSSPSKPATKNELQMLSGNYDSDNKTDIAIFDPASGIWYIRHSDGTPDRSVPFGWSTTIPIGGSDFDGDNKTDLAIFDTGSGRWYIRPSSGGVDWNIPFGWGSTLPIGGMKYDDDNRADLTIYDVNNGHWYIRPSKGGRDADILFGWGSTIPIGGGYYDNDNFTDLALFDKNTGNWHIRHSSGIADTNVSFGWGSVIPVGGGKYDSDNKTDLAIFDPSSGRWYIRPSGGGVDWNIAFGWGSTVPVPGMNSDNDTRSDLTIFDKNMGHWYIRPSQGGVDKFIGFGWRKVIPL